MSVLWLRSSYRTRAAHNGLSDAISGQVDLFDVTNVRQKALKRGLTPGLACRRSNFLIPMGQKGCEVGDRDEHILVFAAEEFAKGLKPFLVSFLIKIDGYQ